MTLLPQMMLPYSIEGFFSEADVNGVLKAVDDHKAANPGRLQAGSTGFTIHASPLLSLDELVKVYEPEGRIDINVQDLPHEAINIMETAFFRHIEDVRRAFPGALEPYGFTYVEYAEGQYFTPHIDGIGSEQVCGFGVTLSHDFEGGEFYVETCGSNRLWTTDNEGQLRVAPEHDSSCAWYRELPRTRWTTKPKRGTALFYGTALTHGSQPVTKGVLKKLLAFVRSMPERAELPRTSA